MTTNNHLNVGLIGSDLAVGSVMPVIPLESFIIYYPLNHIPLSDSGYFSSLNKHPKKECPKAILALKEPTPRKKKRTDKLTRRQRKAKKINH